MSQPPINSAQEPLQFETAEASTPAAAPATWICANCNQPLTNDYYESAGRMICPSCRTNITNALSARGGKERLVLAAVYGSGAALAGALLWWGVRAATGYELGLIAVAVGFMVGYAVRAGAQGIGGRRFQIMAVLLTYFGVAMNYVPDIMKGLAQSSEAAQTKAQDSSDKREAQAAAAPTTGSGSPQTTGNGEKPSFGLFTVILLVGLVLGLAAAAPFLGGASNIIGILIIGFALWEAWKMNRAVEVAFNGPFPVARDGAGAETSAVPAAL